jgi:hypothetical protein
MPEERGRDNIQRPPSLFVGPRECPGNLFLPGMEEQQRVRQGQVVRETTWLERAAGVVGFAWPFVVALFAIVLTAAGVDFSDQTAALLLLCGFLGTPVVIACFYRWLPGAWPDPARALVAVLLAAPCVLIEVSMALVVFGVGYVMAGGYIPA